MKPRTLTASRHSELVQRLKTVDILRKKGFRRLGGWLFTKDGFVYNLTHAALSKISDAEYLKTFVVHLELDDLDMLDMEAAKTIKDKVVEITNLYSY